MTLTTKIFIDRANEIHNNLYDYSRVEYKNSHTKICIIDPEYGEFYQMPYSHLAGHGFQKRKHPLTTKEFIERANKIHKNLYDYSKVDYKESKVKVCIVDSEYGEFC